MNDALISRRLVEVGLEDTVAADGRTLRPMDVAGTERSLPQLSVDLRPDDRGEPPPMTSDLEVRGVIGEGGMGQVLLARQHSLRRDVAVKTAKEGAHAGARAALVEEGAITGQLEHPAIVPVHALGLDESGQPLMVMKRIEGVSWSELIADPKHPLWVDWEGKYDKRLPGHVQILMSICNAVHFAHSRGIVHRDIKPDNVLIGSFGDVYLADWGIAAAVGGEGGALCGTPAFMAPEMARGSRIDERTDVYLLGATLHLLLTGETLHEGRTFAELLKSAVTSEPPCYGDEVPDDLAHLVRGACARDPDERPSTARDFRDALRDHLRHHDSRLLTEGAKDKLDRVVEIHGLATLEEDQRAELDDAVAAARFGLEQAIELWEDNEVANAGLAELDRIVRERREERAKLEKLDWDQSPHVGARSRAMLVTVVALASLIIAGFGMVARSPKPAVLAALPLATLTAIALGTWRYKAVVLANAFNRRGIFMVCVALALLTLGRALGLVVPIAVHEHLARDGFVLAAVFGVAAVHFVDWSRYLAALSLLGGVLATLFPDYALKTFSATAGLIGLLLVYFVWRDGQVAEQARRERKPRA